MNRGNMTFDEIETRVQYFISHLISRGVTTDKLTFLNIITQDHIYHNTFLLKNIEPSCTSSYDKIEGYDKYDLEYIEDIKVDDFVEKFNKSVSCYVQLLDETYINDGNISEDYMFGKFKAVFISV